MFSEIISIGGKNWQIGRKKYIGEGSRVDLSPGRGSRGQSPPAEKEI